MSRSIVMSFVLLSAVLYSFNQPSDKNYDFVSSEKLSFAKLVEIQSPQKHGILAGNDHSVRNRKRTILLQNKPFKPHFSRAKRIMKRPVPQIYRVPAYLKRSAIKRSYLEADSYKKADLVIAIKSELFRLGCYRGKVDTVWGRDVVRQLSVLENRFPITSPEQVTLTYLKRQKSLGCEGSRVMDRLVRSEQKGFVQTAQVQPPAQREMQTQMLEGDDQPFSKHRADKVLVKSIKLSKRKHELGKKRKKLAKRNRRKARKKSFGFDSMFGIGS